MEFITINEEGLYKWEKTESYKMMSQTNFCYMITEICLCYDPVIENLLVEYARQKTTKNLCENVYLPYQFIEKYFSDLEIYWDIIAKVNYFSEEFIEKNFDRFKSRMSSVLCFQDVSQSFIEKNLDHINTPLCWKAISINTKISDSFLLKFRNKVDWNLILENRILSNDALMLICREDRVKNWNLISETQMLTDDFIDEFADLLNWKILLDRCIISPNIADRFPEMIQPYIGLKYGNKSKNFRY